LTIKVCPSEKLGFTLGGCGGQAQRWTHPKGGEMTEEKRAELYTSPGGKFIRADTLPRMLAHWRSMRSAQKQSHFIKYDGELYVGEEIDKLQI